MNINITVRLMEIGALAKTTLHHSYESAML